LKANPKYLTVERKLEKLVSGMQHKERLPSIQEMMKDFNVSQSTLDTSLRHLTERNMITKRRGSGIYVNNPKPKVRRTVAVVVSNLNDRFSSLFLKGLEERLNAAGYRMLLCGGRKDFKRELLMLDSVRNMIDALIVFPVSSSVEQPEYINFFQEMRQQLSLPMVFVDIALPGVTGSFVGFTQYEAFRSITDRLLKKMSDSQIVYIGNMSSLVGVERIQGFKHAVKDYRPDFSNILALNVDSDFPETVMPWDSIKASSQPVFIVADPRALTKLTRELYQRDIKVPEDALVVSIAEPDYHDYVNIPIIALVKPSVELGRKAAELCLEKIKNNKVQTIKYDLKIEVPKELEKFLAS
jgi:DNA-binding LacI/PurR family transcriptional regulator